MTSVVDCSVSRFSVGLSAGLSVGLAVGISRPARFDSSKDCPTALGVEHEILLVVLPELLYIEAFTPQAYHRFLLHDQLQQWTFQG